jgi:hypothetical protein
MTSPADTLRRRIRELRLMLELRPGPAVSRDAMLVHLGRMLEEYDSNCSDMSRAEVAEREALESEVPFA